MIGDDRACFNLRSDVAIQDPSSLVREAIIARLRQWADVTTADGCDPDLIIRGPSAYHPIAWLESIGAVRSMTPVVCIVSHRNPVLALTALDLGARAIVWENERAMCLRDAVLAALHGGVRVPGSLAADVQARGQTAGSKIVISLADLMSDVSLDEIADRRGYSIRQFHRLCRRTYDVVGVSNRAELRLIRRLASLADGPEPANVADAASIMTLTGLS